MACISRIRSILIEHGIDGGAADAICASILKEIGSERHYIARSDFVERNREIMAGFRGNNYTDLADTFGLTPRQVRRIVKRK